MQERETKTEGGKNRARETESATSPFWIEDLAWLDIPKRLIKMEFLMLIFVFSQKG